MFTDRAGAKKEVRKYGARDANVFRCAACGFYHWGHAGGRTRAEIRGEVTGPEPASVPQPMSRLEALAAAYRLDPTIARRNAVMKALRIPADRDRVPRGPDPTAQIAVSNVDRERKSS